MALARRSPGPRYGALLQLLRTAESIWNGSRIFFGRWDLSPSQFNVLNLLRGHPGGLSQMALSRQLIMHRSNVTGLIDRLEERKLVRRLEETSDRRAYRVVLTEMGRQLCDEILPHYYRAAEQLWGGFSVPHVQRLARDLERLARNADLLAQASGK